MTTTAPADPDHLNSSGCVIRYSEGKGRGVFADRFIPRGTLVEISPVLLFGKEEYETHGKHTILDHYTFVWPGGRMALALGLGSLFNHSDPPNVSFSLDPHTQSIRYTTSQDIQPGQELCIFYGYNLWFNPSEGTSTGGETDVDDGWGGLAGLEGEELPTSVVSNPFADGNPDDVIEEEDLPFIRYKPPPDEETPESIRTVEAWVVDVPEPRHLGPLIKWIKQAKLESPDVAHLKRIRKNLQTGETSLLLSISSTSPSLPEHLDLPPPYRVMVPASSALTAPSLALKNAIWPTMFTPKRKDEVEPWTRGKAKWAWDAMRVAIEEAEKGSANSELSIGAYIASPYNPNPTQPIGKPTPPFVAHDTRTSTNHPLRHAAINAIRKLADYQAVEHPALPKSFSSPSDLPPETSQVKDSDLAFLDDESSQIQPTSPKNSSIEPNGTNYLLTNLSIFLTHEPCIMCSMALLHSRVRDVFYLHPMPKTGGCGSLACLPTLKNVNHRFGIGRWKDKLGCMPSESRVDEHIDA